MQAVILWMLGTSWPHSRMASPVHICCASDEKARPGRAESAVAAQVMAKRSAILLVRWMVIEPFPKGCARCWPLFTGGAARGLRCRTRRPSPGSYPVWLLDFCRCPNRKVLRHPTANYARMLRSCNGCINTSLDCCECATSTEAQARDNSIPAPRLVSGRRGSRKERRCVSPAAPSRSNRPPGERACDGRLQRGRGASRSGRCSARCLPGLSSPSPKLRTNAENSGVATTTR
jgi:hypothetical protein